MDGDREKDEKVIVNENDELSETYKEGGLKNSKNLMSK